MFGWLINGIVEALKFLNGFVHNYGVTIILFTLIIKLLLYPLTAKQTKSMKAMQDLQPEMDKIKKKHKDDKEKQQQAMMDLYKEHNVNPAAGCLPMIFQLAILIPLYRAILSLSDVLNDASFLWIGTLTNGSLAEPDVAIVLVNALAMIGQTYVTQKMQSGGGGKSNMIMWIMPAFIIFIGFQLPSGILLYWFTSTVFTAIQQYVISNETVEEEVAEQ
ncbi:MAG TPA: YidC/Oxa1 family membrane protein insertase [Halanaerobiales bacterium]|nr:YidC/Oxa1 family membrane protein insertase [Halanaerobiales bacterium]